MLVGKHGIGKSEILTRFFERQGLQVVTLFLGQMSDPGDLIGLPRMDEQTGRTVFMPPYWFPVDGKPVVLFLDELNRARPEVLQTIMDLALNRKLAGRNLPEGSRLISAVNDGEEYQLTDLDPALVSRFNIYTFQPSVPEWLMWAAENKLDSRVIEFIRATPKFLDSDGTTSTFDRGLQKTPDRRAWKKVSDCISSIDNLESVHKKMLAGIVGAAATQAFVSFLGTSRLLSGKDILLEFQKHKDKLKKYKLHEVATVNEDIFQFIELGGQTPEQKKVMAENLKKYIEELQKAKRNEEIAHFASFFEKDTYKNALSFVVTEVPAVYETIIGFIENL
jgi:hypothetical protein